MTTVKKVAKPKMKTVDLTIDLLYALCILAEAGEKDMVGCLHAPMPFAAQPPTNLFDTTGKVKVQKHPTTFKVEKGVGILHCQAVDFTLRTDQGLTLQPYGKVEIRADLDIKGANKILDDKHTELAKATFASFNTPPNFNEGDFIRLKSHNGKTIQSPAYELLHDNVKIIFLRKSANSDFAIVLFVHRNGFSQIVCHHIDLYEKDEPLPVKKSRKKTV